MKKHMLFRFSLYGFLKNQQYFEPFLVLAFMDKGLSFFTIGLLIAWRELMINVLEIPSGAIADLFGRRQAMVLAFTGYIISFLTFALAEHLPLLFMAMTLFAVGDSFRSGTHKSLIFNWLRLNNREQDRLRIYGFTRSWSKFGSAVSVLFAGIFVYTTQSYTMIFYLSALPYLANIVNLLSYPEEIDPLPARRRSPRQVWQHIRAVFVEAFTRKPLRTLLLEAMGYEGTFRATKDYLQPVLKTSALSLAALSPALASLNEVQQSAILVGAVYFLLNILSAFGSRNAWRLSESSGGEEKAATWLWSITLPIYALIAVAAYLQWYLPVILAFSLLFILQNFWRPLLVSRIDSFGKAEHGATLLSVESQLRRIGTMIMAPAIGYAVDLVHGQGQGGSVWPVGLFGAVIVLSFIIYRSPARPANGEN